MINNLYLERNSVQLKHFLLPTLILSLWASASTVILNVNIFYEQFIVNFSGKAERYKSK